jgi:hypothetical protein
MCHKVLIEGRLGTLRDAGHFGTQGGRCSIERRRDGHGHGTKTLASLYYLCLFLIFVDFFHVYVFIC